MLAAWRVDRGGGGMGGGGERDFVLMLSLFSCPPSCIRGVSVTSI